MPKAIRKPLMPTMRRIVILTICVLSFSCLIASAQQQQRPAGDVATGVLQQLLYLPAPPPRTSEGAKAEKERPDEFYNADNAPADDAPLEALLDYWERWSSQNQNGGPKPSAAVRERLLSACEEDPQRLRSFLQLMEGDAKTAERVKKLYDDALGNSSLEPGVLKMVHDWLQLNSKYFLNDLSALAQKVKDKEGYVNEEEALKALAQVDWPSAEPLLEILANGNQPRVAALALVELYNHALREKETDNEEKYRARLQLVAADRNAPGRARDTAIQALSLSDWSGRDEWYLSLFSDETLLEPQDGYYQFNPLTTLFDKDPDKWIPVMTKLVESKNRNIQQAAASCLAIYSITTPRRDAILPVLRWLSDPDWLKLNPTKRAWFMQTMDDINIPESVPGLIWIVENEESNRHWAAKTLGYYKDPRARVVLKKALLKEENAETRQYLIEGLIASGGMTEAEQLSALEAYAAKISTVEGRTEIESNRTGTGGLLPLPVSIGRYLAQTKDVPESLVTALLERAEELEKKSPELARSMLEVAQGWPAQQVERDMLRRIAFGKADAATITKALERRDSLMKRAHSEVQSLVSAGGAPLGIATVLLSDEALAQAVLGSSDWVAQLALLACARLVQMPLPAAVVGELANSKNPVLVTAAERYLLAEDSKQAREILLARHPSQAFITGWRENYPAMSGYDFDAMGKVEDKLRAELFKDAAPLEVFALMGNIERPTYVVRVYANRATYTFYEDDARYLERTLTEEEVTGLKNFITNNNLADMGPQVDSCYEDCTTVEFLLLSKQGGRRVFSRQPVGVMDTLRTNLNALGSGPGIKVHYNLEAEIKGLEVLVSDAAVGVRDVWKRGADLRLFIERDQTQEEKEQEAQLYSSYDDEETAESATLRRQSIEAARRALFSWRAFKNGRLAETVARPEGYVTLDEDAFGINYEGGFPSSFNQNIAQASAGDFVILAGFPELGLWKKAKGGSASRISEAGNYMNPIVTPDGRWVVAAKTDTDWGDPNYVVRLDTSTGKEYRVALPPAQEFYAIAFLSVHGKFLLRRARDENDPSDKEGGPETPEFYLLDAATGQTQLVAGVFDPLLQEGKRFLQPAANPSEFWAAIPNDSKDDTTVGRYNLKDFSFRKVLVIPHLTFDSMQMWVDEGEAKLYIVYEGQLIRLPLPGPQQMKPSEKR
jgi:hypothetical protein